MKKIVLLLLCPMLFSSLNAISQVGVGTTVPEGALDVSSGTNGILVPRVSLTAKNISAPVVNPNGGGTPIDGTLVWNLATNGVSPNNVSPGFYYWQGTSWKEVGSAATNQWALLGNSGTSSATNFIGTTDAQDLRFRTNSTNRFNIGNASGALTSYGNGAAATPSYSWNASANTGIFLPSAGNIGFSSSGAERFRIPSANQVHAMSLGTAALPFYSFSADPNTGLYSEGADIVSISTAGTERIRIEADGDAHIGAGAPNASAKLQVTATDRGILIPNVALTAKNAAAPVTAPATSLLVYNTATSGTAPNNVVPGFYYWTGSAWNEIGNTSTNQWALSGNSGTTAGTNYLGTSDAQDLRFKTAATDRFNISNTLGQLASYGTGSVNGPSYSWIGNTNTGMFLPAASNIGFATSGTEKFRIPNANQVHAMSGGTAALPFYSFSGNTAAGLWSPATNVIGLSTAGTERFRIPNANQVHAMSFGTAALPFYSFGSGTSTGMWAAGANILNFSTNGNERVRILGNGNFLINTTTGNSKLDVDWGSANYDVILGTNTSADGTGINGVGENSLWNGLVDGSGGAFSSDHTGIYAYFDTFGTGSGMIIQDVVGEQWNVGHWNNTTAQYYKIIGTGAVSTIVKDLNDDRVVMHCTETPENLFEDYGVGELSNGKAHVLIDPVFAKNIVVSEQHPIKIFVQLEGDCNGVYVANKSANSFDVIELKGGTSNTKFSYSIVATRADETYVSPTGVTRVAKYGSRFEPAPAKQASRLNPKR